jgi:hypothetical protein
MVQSSRTQSNLKGSMDGPGRVSGDNALRAVPITCGFAQNRMRTLSAVVPEDVWVDCISLWVETKVAEDRW